MGLSGSGSSMKRCVKLTKYRRAQKASSPGSLNLGLSFIRKISDHVGLRLMYFLPWLPYYGVVVL